MQLLSLIKANFSEGMNIFKVGKGSKLKKAFLTIILFSLILISFGYYAYEIASFLHQVNLTYIVLSIALTTVMVTSFIEGIYKSQGILFETSDNDLLFSLPIKKSTIFFVRILKLLVFQILFNTMFLLPCMFVYAYFENPGVSYYLLSFLMLIIAPIIPTVLSCIIGYLIKGISSKFKSKKLIQTIFSLIMLLVIYFLSFSMNNVVDNLQSNALNINNTLSKINFATNYYINLINEFNLLDFLKLILINFIPLILLVYLGSIYYFKIIFNFKETNVKHTKYKVHENKISTPLKALVKKEFNKYITTPVYMINTLFGGILLLIMTIAFCTNTTSLIDLFNKSENTNISIYMVYNYLPKIFYGMVLFGSFTTSITSSSISIEGTKINLLKSLPVDIKTIFKSKIIFSNLVLMPFILLSDLIFLISFKINILDIVFIILASILVPILTSLLGLYINLLKPKMIFKTETEVVKQSIAVVISVYTGIFLLSISIGLLFIFNNNLNLVVILELLVYLLSIFMLIYLLKRKGEQKFKEITV